MQTNNGEPVSAAPLPVCPRCGCVARVAVVQRARVRCEIDPDGTVGRVLSMSREASVIDAYECGGGHVWKVGQ